MKPSEASLLQKEPGVESLCCASEPVLYSAARFRLLIEEMAEPSSVQRTEFRTTLLVLLSNFLQLCNDPAPEQGLDSAIILCSKFRAFEDLRIPGFFCEIGDGE